MNSDNSVFYIKIKDGHSFRSMLAMVKTEANRIMAHFTDDFIEFDYCKKNDINIGYKIVLNVENFEKYHFKPREKDMINGECIIGIDVAEFYNATKGIGTRDSIIFYRRYIDDNDPKISIIHVKSSNKEESDPIVLFSKIVTPTPSTKRVKDIDSRIPPNVKVHPKSFAEVCNFVNTTNCCHLGIDGFENGAVMKGKHSVETYKFIKPYGFDDKSKNPFNPSELENIIDTDKYNRKIISVTNIPKKIVKSIAKFNNISSSKENGYIKFYFNKNYITIKGEISNFGVCSVFLSNDVRKE